MKKLLYILPIAFLLGSCKKTLDINNNPNDPTSLAVEVLLPSVEKNLGDALAFGNGDRGGLSQVLAVYTHQMSTREEPNQYNATSNEFYLQLAWPVMYEEVIADLDEIIKASEVTENKLFSGIAKVLKAYAFSQFVDVFGDIPFSEVNNKEFTYPKFDDDKDIYPKLIALLDEGIADLNGATGTSAASDLIYGGNKTKWIKAANTIKLKLYTQIRKVDDVSAEVSALLSNPATLINDVKESFLIPYGTNRSPDDRNPGFGDYYATQRSNHVSPWLYEIMKGYNPNIFAGIQDPRIPYYIYNQLGASGSSAALRDGVQVGQTEYRDGGFLSIYFGSVGEDRDRNQQKNISLFGIYPVGGRYDDGGAKVADVNSGTGAAPYRMITFADRLYLEAELIQTGVVTGNAKAVLQKAIEESFRQIDYVITTYVKPGTAGSPQTVPAIFDAANATSPMNLYIKDVMLGFDAANAEKKLEIIMTQKWLSSVGSSVDQYTDIRRTGYPKVFNPNDLPNNEAKPPLNGDPLAPGPQQPVPVVLGKTYPFSLPWPADELDVNSNAPEQKNPSSYKVFWQP